MNNPIDNKELEERLKNQTDHKEPEKKPYDYWYDNPDDLKKYEIMNYASMISIFLGTSFGAALGYKCSSFLGINQDISALSGFLIGGGLPLILTYYVITRKKK